MEPIGFVNRISAAAANIDYGRKGFATRGKEQKGRLFYETGIADAMTVFKEVQASADPQTIILAEYTFLSQELQLCPENDTEAIRSLTNGIESLDDTFLALKITEKPALYQAAEKTYPRRSESRVNGFPKDAFHIACTSHRTRLKNAVSTTGVDIIEKSLIRQRRINLTTAQKRYVKKQETALTAAESLATADGIL